MAPRYSFNNARVFAPALLGAGLSFAGLASADAAPEAETDTEQTTATPGQQHRAPSPHEDTPKLDVVAPSDRPNPAAAPRAREVAGSVLPRERFLQPGATSASVLREAPGVQVTEVGGLGAPATASLRGASAAQTPVYFGGVRLNDEIAGVADLGDVATFFVERAEIYRSHAPAADEPLGLGGAIYFEPLRPEGARAALNLQAGSWGTRSLAGYVGVGDERSSLLTGALLSETQNNYPYSSRGGLLLSGADGRTERLNNADSALDSFWAHARHHVQQSEFSLLLNLAERNQGAPKLALVPSQRARIDFSRQLLALQSKSSLGDATLTLGTNLLSAETTLSDPDRELGQLHDLTETRGVRWQHSVRLDQPLSAEWEISPALSLASEDLLRVGSEAASNVETISSRRFSARGGLGSLWRFTENNQLHALLQTTCQHTSQGELMICEELSQAGRLSLSRHRPSYELFASAGHYQRDPSLGERYGVSLLVRGNPALRAEVGESYEAGARWQAARAGAAPLVWLEAAGYLRLSRELVSYVKSAQGYLTPVNLERARTVGGELSAGANPLSFVEAQASLSLIDARNLTPGRSVQSDQLPFISPLSAALVATLYAPLPALHLERAAVTTRYVHQSSRFADHAGLAVVPVQGQLDLELSVQTQGRWLEFRGRVANVLDQARFDVVGFPLPGRSYFVALEGTWL